MSKLRYKWNDLLNKYELKKIDFNFFLPLFCVVIFVVLYVIHFYILGLKEFEVFKELKKIEEFSNRIRWGFASVFLYLMIFLCCIFSFFVLMKNLDFGKSKVFSVLFTMTLPVITMLFYFFYTTGVSGESSDNLLTEIGKLNGYISIKNFIDITMSLSVISVLYLILSMGSIIRRPKSLSIISLSKRYQQYNYSLVLTSIFLVAGILQVYFLYDWAIVNGELGNDEGKLILKTLSASGGLIYSIIFILIFLPAGFQLSRRSQELAKLYIKEDSDETIESWTVKNGLSLSPLKMTRNFAALILPNAIPIFLNMLI